MRRRLRTISKVRRLARSERGGTLAELAILIPFIVVMLAVVSELGRFFQTYTTLSKATRSAARYLSNHQFNNLEKGRAKNLVVCGKLVCNGGDELVSGLSADGIPLSADNVCIQTTLTPQATVETITVSIARQASVSCEDGGNATWFRYRPVFDIGALLNNPDFSLVYPIAPSTTMRYIPAE